MFLKVQSLPDDVNHFPNNFHLAILSPDNKKKCLTLEVPMGSPTKYTHCVNTIGIDMP